MAYANPDAVTQIANGLSTTTFSYDADGNVTQKTVDGTTTTYVYDYANRLTALGVLGATTTYAYDWAGNRVSQTGTSTTFIYPFKWYSVASSTGTGAKYATTTDYVFNGDSLVATVDQQTASGNATGTAKTRYIHPDHLGSTNVVTDENDTVVQTLDYYPYGATRISTNTGGADSARKYVNRFADQSNLDYLTARYYDPARGQFITEDPVFWSNRQNLYDPQSLNSYSYANDNPITKKDPDGQAATLSSLLQSLASALRLLLNMLTGVSAGGGGANVNAGVSGASKLSSPVMTNNITMPMRPTTWDAVTDKRINQLDPRVQQPATNFVNDTQDWMGVKLRVNEGYRSIEDQDKLYAQGRSAPGNVVTNAKGGQSYHNYGKAIDVVIVNNGQPDWSQPITPEIAQYAKQQGFQWGGDWNTSFKDYPHFQMPLGQSIATQP
jgi:RHS repeat-associated protein